MRLCSKVQIKHELYLSCTIDFISMHIMDTEQINQYVSKYRAMGFT